MEGQIEPNIENGYIESFNEKHRVELLDREVFDTMPEAKVFFEGWCRSPVPEVNGASLRAIPTLIFNTGTCCESIKTASLPKTSIERMTCIEH